MPISNLRHLLTTLAAALLLALTPLFPAAADTTLFSDDFNRPDSDTVGNGWSVDEGNGDIDIAGNRLFFTATNDESNRPLMSHTFTKATSGFVSWSFSFDWTRTGSEGTYRLFMQLGDSTAMTTPSSGVEPDAGVAVNLVWTQIGGTNESLGYAVSGAYMSLGQVSGPSLIEVVADLDTQTYAVFVDGSGVVCGIPFDNAVDIDTVRIVSDLINESNFSGRTFDDIVVTQLDSGPVGGWPPVAQAQSVSTDEDTAVDITLTAIDCDDNVLNFTIVDPPLHGDLTGIPPDVTYTPDPGYKGTDSFPFMAGDGTSDSNIAYVSISIAGDTGALNDIGDFSETVDGIFIYWEKARYADIKISGTGTEDIPFGVAHPSGYDPAAPTKYPLVLYLHGAGARGDNNAALVRSTARFFAKSARVDPASWNAFVLTPQCPGGSRWVEWNWSQGPYNQTDIPGNTYGEYMHLTEGLLDYMTDSANNGALLGVLGIDAADIDLSRVYVVGDSMGAYGTWDIVARMPGFFAGAISSGGSGPKNRLDELRLTPFWAIHGENDTTVPNTLPSPGDPDGAGSLGMMGLLDPGFNNTVSTATVYKDDPLTDSDNPPLSWSAFIYSEYANTGHAPAADWTTRAISLGARAWLFAQATDIGPQTCTFDTDIDFDVDGTDLKDLIDNFDPAEVAAFAIQFGTLCQ